MTGITRVIGLKGLWGAALAAVLSMSGCGGGGGGGGDDKPSSESTYSISVSAVPADGGSVSGGGTYDADAQVAVNAVANSGYSFVNWTEGGTEVSTNTSLTFNATADRTLVAHFSLGDYTVSTSAGTGGRFNPSDQGVEYGDTADFTIEPDEGYYIAEVSGCGGTFNATSNTFTTGSVTKDCLVSASFSTTPVSLVPIGASASPVAGGTIIGGGSYGEGSSVTLTAAANEGYTFVNWTEDGSEVSTSADYGFSVTAERSLVANFSLNSYTVSTNPGANGIIDPVNVTVVHGNTTNLAIKPDTGYVIDSVTGCGGSLSGTTFTTGKVTEDCVVEATFGMPVEVLSFEKTSEYTLEWTTSNANSCQITNDYNSEVLDVVTGTLAAGKALHPLSAGTTFTLTCQGAGGTTASLSASTVGTDPFPQTVGYYGSASSLDNSWTAIVNLTSPITFSDRIDFNSQVDSYCSGLGYVGAAKTKTGSFSVHDTYYLQSSDGIIEGRGPSAKATLIPGDLTYTNVYTNRRNTDSSNGNVGRATIGNNASSIDTSVPSPTSGDNQMVLCQTDILFGNSTSLPQAIAFADPGPIRKVQGVDEPTFVNAASGGVGSGAVTYVSSDPAVATVDEATGEVTLVALGTTTVTATKAADTFVEAQASYTLTVDSPQPVDLQSFTKTSDNTLSWSTGEVGTLSCEITNDQNSEVLTVSADTLSLGTALHPLPAGTTFTLTCQGEDGSSATASVTTVATNEFPQTVGYWGSASSASNSWAAIVNLTSPITFADGLDFNAQVDSYCAGLGYVGVVKTKTGDFSTHDTSYLHADSLPGVVWPWEPSRQVAVISGDATIGNVYSNGSNHFSYSQVTVSTLGNGVSSTSTSVTSPTSGDNQMVLCQTDIPFRNTTSLPQTIAFAEPGPIRKVQGVDEPTFANAASGGYGKGAITYVSSDPAVATVNETTGEVTLVALGTTTITATKAADAFVEAQASYTLTVDSPQPIDLQSFTKTSDYTLSWSTGGVGTLSCEITNDYNSEVLNVSADRLTSGTALHPLPAGTTFTMTCQGEDGSSATASATTVASNDFPQTVGYWGSPSSESNSWVAIVNLTSPITFTDGLDFNAQVDSYCAGLGYVGVVKTKTGDFATHDTYYLHSGSLPGVVWPWEPSKQVTSILGDATLDNVYSNGSNHFSYARVTRTSIGDNKTDTVATSVASPTSGDNQRVLCQTDISFANTTSLPQAIAFADEGPLRKVQGLDTDFVNIASGGLGSGAITYASSDPSVATVDDTSGKVTIVGLGTTTITATKAADAFAEAQASYTLTVDIPRQLNLTEFIQSTGTTLHWSMDYAVSCQITNNQNSDVINLVPSSLASGGAMHTLPAGTSFTLTCEDETGAVTSHTETAVVANQFPYTAGYWGSANSESNSWVAIVDLTSPITFTDGLDFNAQVDSYCAGLGYVGVVKTKKGDFATSDTFYLHAGYYGGLTYVWEPSNQVTLIPGDATIGNIYVNSSNHLSYVNVLRARIGDNTSVNESYSVASPTSGDGQMVLCQTDIPLGNSKGLPQSIGFADPGPFRKVPELDGPTFTNKAVGGLGLGDITYVSSDPAVATVNETTGEVTFVGLGTTTITATKAADAFVEAQASYTLTVDSPQPANLKSFIKSTANTLRWSADYVVSCAISNDQDGEVITLSGEDMNKGNSLHSLPAGATFTLTCEGEDGVTSSASVTTVTNLYPQTVGYYGSATSEDNSWVAIVNLTSPITYADAIDFNSQVDSYCTGLGYVGTAKTKTGDFSTHDTYYLQGQWGVISQNGPSQKVTLIPGDAVFTNVYANETHYDGTWTGVERVTIGNNDSVGTNASSPTSGDNQMVLCQTDIPLRTSALLPQVISFVESGPVRTVQGLDTAYSNIASGGKGSGEITYASSNPNVATVDPTTGDVTLLSLGTTTITATKAADAYFQQAQASYELIFDAPMNLDIQSFTETSASTLAWNVGGAVSCDITNDQNSVVTPITLDKQATGYASGRLLHGMPEATVFTITCEGETGSSGSLVASAGTDPFPQTVGYYGSAYTMDSAWVAIVNLTTTISFVDRFDFNNKVDSYCAGLGYVGAAKTKQGDFSVDDTYYYWESNGLIDVSGSPNKVTLLPAGTTFTNIYVNRAHDAGGFGTVGTATIASGNFADYDSTVALPGTTGGTNPMVLCQTDFTWPETALITQTVSFNDPGPVFKTLGVDSSFRNDAYGSVVDDPVTFESSNPGVATVDMYGNVTLLSVGTTTITATISPEFGIVEAQASYTLDVQ